jgi:hypothetical protein
MIPGHRHQRLVRLPADPRLRIFFLAAMAELSRPPFDMPIADSELVFGYMTEYTGIKFAMFLLTEYAGMISMSALMVVLYLGGWQLLPGVPLPGCDGRGRPVRLRPARHAARRRRDARQDHALVFVMVWARVAYPRLREDQLQRCPGSCSSRCRCSTSPSSPSRRWCSRWPTSRASACSRASASRSSTCSSARPRRCTPRAAGPAAAHPRRHRADGRELHRLHAVQPRVPRLVHLHRLPQGDGAAGQGGRPRPDAQRPRPLRDRLRAVHVLRHLRRGVPVRRAVVVAGVRVRRVRRSPSCSTRRTSCASGWTPSRRRRRSTRARARPPRSPTRIAKARRSASSRPRRPPRPSRRRRPPPRRPPAGRWPKAAKADESRSRRARSTRRPTTQLIAEGKSERIARSKAKAAYVKKEKAKLQGEQARRPRPRPPRRRAEGRRGPRRGRPDRPGDLRRADRRGQVRAHGPGQGQGRLRQEGEGPAARRGRGRAEAPPPAPAAEAPPRRPPATRRPPTPRPPRRAGQEAASSPTSTSRAPARSTRRPTTG